jgi:hypothetical protein
MSDASLLPAPQLSAVAGRAAGSRDDKKLPLYDKHSFVRHLDAAGVTWRWYSYDIGTLRCVDDEQSFGALDERSRGIGRVAIRAPGLAGRTEAPLVKTGDAAPRRTRESQLVGELAE